MELISECFVKPKHEQLNPSKQPSIIYLNPVEIVLLRIYPIQKGLVYALNNNPSNTLNNLVNDVKNSLSLALDHFYPLAGRLATQTLADEHSCTVFIDCTKGPGARLTHVVAKHVTISDLVSSPRVPSVTIRKLFDLGEECLNYEGHTRALLSVQVTELVDGVFIGFTANHSVVDGASFMHFLMVLSEIFKTTTRSTTTTGGDEGLLLEISRVPVFEQGSVIKLPYLGIEEFMIRHENDTLADRVFHFSSKSMAMIKARANEDINDKTNGDEGESIPNVSSFQGLLSLIWRSITRARNLSPDQETVCNVPINTRTRVDPPVSDNYVGNYLAQTRVKCSVGELLGHDLGWAAKRVNEAIRSKDGKSIQHDLTMMAQLIVKPGFLNDSGRASFLGPNHVVLGGSPRFDMYGLEFGLGRAGAARMGPGNKTDGKINASQGREGGGSVELEITLKEEHMAALEADYEIIAFAS